MEEVAEENVQQTAEQQAHCSPHWCRSLLAPTLRTECRSAGSQESGGFTRWRNVRELHRPSDKSLGQVEGEREGAGNEINRSRE